MGTSLFPQCPASKSSEGDGAGCLCIEYAVERSPEYCAFNPAVAEHCMPGCATCDPDQATDCWDVHALKPMAPGNTPACVPLPEPITEGVWYRMETWLLRNASAQSTLVGHLFREDAVGETHLKTVSWTLPTAESCFEGRCIPRNWMDPMATYGFFYMRSGSAEQGEGSIIIDDFDTTIGLGATLPPAE
jgi:hypothetical protein